MDGGIGREGVPNYRSSINTGYIFIPENFRGEENRKKFIQDCLRRERVSIFIENGGGASHNCYITRQTLRDIEFPDVAVNERLEEKDSISRLGSQVIFLSEPYLDHPIIIGTVSKLNETQLLNEREFKVLRSKNGSFALLSMNGNTGEINISTYGHDTKSDLNIIIANNNDNAQLNLSVRGDINIITTGTTNITAGGDINLTTKTNTNLVTEGDVTIKPVKKLLVGEAKEPMLLGTTTFTALEKEKKALKDTIDAINTVTPLPVPANAVDPTWALVKAKLALIIERGDYSKIKSEKSFID